MYATLYTTTAPTCHGVPPSIGGGRRTLSSTYIYICKSVDHHEKPKTQEYTIIYLFKDEVNNIRAANCLTKAKATNAADKLTGLLLHSLLLSIFILHINKILEYVSEHLYVNAIHIHKIPYLY